jgi:hypothetical protein
MRFYFKQMPEANLLACRLAGLALLARNLAGLARLAFLTCVSAGGHLIYSLLRFFVRGLKESNNLLYRNVLYIQSNNSIQ